jgi:hypothetical protein
MDDTLCIKKCQLLSTYTKITGTSRGGFHLQNKVAYLPYDVCRYLHFLKKGCAVVRDVLATLQGTMLQAGRSRVQFPMRWIFLN